MKVRRYKPSHEWISLIEVDGRGHPDCLWGRGYVASSPLSSITADRQVSAVVFVSLTPSLMDPALSHKVRYRDVSKSNTFPLD